MSHFYQEITLKAAERASGFSSLHLRLHTLTSVFSASDLLKRKYTFPVCLTSLGGTRSKYRTWLLRQWPLACFLHLLSMKVMQKEVSVHHRSADKWWRAGRPRCKGSQCSTHGSTIYKTPVKNEKNVKSENSWMKKELSAVYITFRRCEMKKHLGPMKYSLYITNFPYPEELWPTEVQLQATRFFRTSSSKVSCWLRKAWWFRKYKNVVTANYKSITRKNHWLSMSNAVFPQQTCAQWSFIEYLYLRTESSSVTCSPPCLKADPRNSLLPRAHTHHPWVWENLSASELLVHSVGAVCNGTFGAGLLV